MKTLIIDESQKIFLDGEELTDVIAYKLENSAEHNELAKLTVTVAVNVDRVGSLLKKQSKRERLEEALLTFIEKTTKEPFQESDVLGIPAMTHELIELWKS